MNATGNRGLKVPNHLEPISVKFSIFTTKDVKSLSVQPVVTSLVTDALGHPVQGGLYDKKLGPSGGRNETCGTCNENLLNCPGHFSYIQLPVPVINPIFHKIIGTILKYSCPDCYKMQLEEKSRIALSTIDTELIEPTDIVKLLAEEVKTVKICIFCKSYMNKIQVFKNRILLTTRKIDKFEIGEKSSVMSNLQHVKTLESQYVNPAHSKNYLRKIWKNEEEIIRKMAPILNDVELEHPTDAFFLEAVLVPPPNVRPMNVVNGRAVENPQTTGYKNIVTNALVMGHLISVVQKKGDESALLSKEAEDFYAVARGNTPIEKLNNCWEELQNNVNGLLNKENENAREGVGLKQIIEKKSGIIRQNMMGKRVNFAARSVITPDPNLDIGEVGVPELFAKRLTYPVPVTPWNVEYLRTLISNGPEVYPGAVSVEMEDGSVKRINPNNHTQQESLLKVLLTPHNLKKQGFQGVKIVHRHLQNGDVLLLNRQPTLHKPSIMAHRARILKGEKTMRMHYSNCKAYNADFDGDEMNAHFPQDEVARSEGYNIAEVAQQYLVPKDGTPLAGLIQDFIIAGVRLSLRGRFVDCNDYQQLVFQALSHKTDNIEILPPAILKPVPMWSGKQVLSTVIINVIPKGQKLINLTAGSKIAPKAWQTDTPREWVAGGTAFKDDRTMSEAEVIIRNGELLSGILDKTHYGPTAYGLAHCMYELYGGTCALQLLSSFTKLFMCMLQYDGFTLGVHDILTLNIADKHRRKTMKKLRKIGKEVMTTVLNLPSDTPVDEIVQVKEEMVGNDPKFVQLIDRQYKQSLDSYTNKINRICLPAGLICKFPENNLQLMVQSGAKGSTVNTMQISCLLGQIELEGKRPPVLISGRSLPSFPISEFAPRAGGFIDGRFMTGIQPQEFFFHCMAGREGLIDTAVKTSRSGYLQRCLIKHLEGLHVGYDLTVRNSNGNVIQFLYGEDGLDISKAQFLNEKQMPFLLDNSEVVVRKDIIKKLKEDEGLADVEAYRNKLESWLQNNNGDPFKKHRHSPFSLFGAELFEETGLKLPQTELYKLWRGMPAKDKQAYIEKGARCPNPLSSEYQPDHYFGSTNERLDKLEAEFLKGKKKKVRKGFDNMLKFKAMRSLCAPGEAVGLLAAQSIGEPSTQMTLNTFHFAGRGEMNVTLGIPRLREILMMASKNIKTPSMEIPFLNVPDLESKADDLKRKLTRVAIGDLLHTANVKIKLKLQPRRVHQYTIRFQFLPKDCCEEYYAPIRSVLKHMKKKLFKEMFVAIDKFSKVKGRLVTMEEEKAAPKFPRKGGDDDDDDDDGGKKGGRSAGQRNEDSSSDEEVEDQEDAKQASKHKEAHEDQDPEDEEEKMDAESDDETEDNENSNKQNGEDEWQEDESRYVTDNYAFATDYQQDKKERWCELTFSLPMSYRRIDMRAILNDVAHKSVLWQTPNIKRAITYLKDDKLTLRTDGINLLEMFKYHDLLDLNRLYCNDVHKMTETYGIEAASKIIVKEVKDVFNVYGITVDPRHLSLVADYMTSSGTYEPMSRKGMEKNASPLHQMSFESSSAFLKEATLKGRIDDLQNPSSCLMLGKPCRVGTECFDVLNKLPTNTANIGLTEAG